MSGFGRVCERCNGRGIVYLRTTSQACPRCAGARPGRGAEQLEAITRLRACWARFTLGETGDYNIELAVRLALDAGLSPDQLHRRAGVSRECIRRAGAGQLAL